jgi:hypothetical protein
MQVLVFVNPKDASKELLHLELAKMPGIDSLFVHSRQSLARILKSKTKNFESVIFVVTEQKDLNLAVSLQPYLRILQFILILPNKNAQMVSQALALHPSLVGFSDGLKNAVSVLAKIAALETVAPETPNHKKEIKGSGCCH